MSKSAPLKTKVAVVPGGGGGIGKAISLNFAKNGAKVVVAEIEDEQAEKTVVEIRNSGGEAIASVVDVQESEQVSEMVKTAFGEYGQVDILVNNVGDFLMERIKPFLLSTEEDWEAYYRINLKHVFLCTKAIVPRMIERGAGGSVVNVSTIEAFRGIPNLAIYSAFKAGITAFTKSVALEMAEHGIRVNAIAPDNTETRQVPLRGVIVPPEYEDRSPCMMPLGRFGEPDDIAGVALFLASDLSRFVTGTTVHADGGTLAASGWYRTLDERGWTNLPRDP
jgi:NAD(P)-dependent dehydrogenase (short-subunit alcohol dehydrogenase family)